MAAPHITANSVVYVISGASRGLGYSVTERLAQRPDALIYATARDPSKAEQLQQLASKYANIRVLKLRVDSDADHTAAAAHVQAEAGRVDVVLANAGIADPTAFKLTSTQSPDQLREHFEVNTIGPVRLFNAFFPLLSKSSNPKYIVVSSVAGSVGSASSAALAPFLTATYGASKAATNYVTQRIFIEHPNIVAFPLQPGWVQTEMGNKAASSRGKTAAPITIEQSVDGYSESHRRQHSREPWWPAVGLHQQHGHTVVTVTAVG